MVYDGNNLIYKVNKFGFFVPGFNMRDYHNNQVIQIKNVPKFGFFKFKITDKNGREIAHVDQKFSFGSTKLDINSEIGILSLESNFKNSEFTIFNDKLELAKVSRKKYDSKNYITMGVRGDIRQELIIGIVLAIILFLSISRGN